MDLQGRLSNPLASLVKAAELLPTLLTRPLLPGISNAPTRQVQRRLNASTIAALFDRRTEGATIELLATEFGVHRTTVIAHLHRSCAAAGRERSQTDHDAHEE